MRVPSKGLQGVPHSMIPAVQLALTTLFVMKEGHALRMPYDAVLMRGAVSEPNNENIQNQISHATLDDRYPDIFKKAQTTLGKDSRSKILSFGCSIGQEVRSLRKYFPNSIIHGIDVDEEIIDKNEKENNDTQVQYFSKANDLLPSSYDAIFAMSSLCRNPGPPVPFKLFERTVSLIDHYLSRGGFLVLYNSNYCFTDTDTVKLYENIGVRDATYLFESGWVGKYFKNGTLLEDHQKNRIPVEGLAIRESGQGKYVKFPYVFFQKH